MRASSSCEFKNNAGSITNFKPRHIKKRKKSKSIHAFDLLHSEMDVHTSFVHCTILPTCD